jgi:threonine-phosphate decarboxylase
MKEHHGGDIYRNSIQLDFSVNVSPLGLPSGAAAAYRRSVKDLGHYPEPDSAALRAAIGRKRHIPAGQIFCGNGASELLQLIVSAQQPRRVLLPVPSFVGYRHALQGCGRVDVFRLRERDGFALTEEFLHTLQGGSYDMTILCSPNNPTGRRIDDDLLRRTAECCRQNGIRMVVDECFLSLTPDGEEHSMVPLLKNNPQLVAVDAFTKTYAMPGLRIGYAMSSDTGLMQQLQAKAPEWPVSVPAQAAALAALEDTDYTEKAAAVIARERFWLDRQLQRLGFRTFPGEANYIFFRTPERDGGPDRELYQCLLGQGILIRRCDDYDGLPDAGRYYRIAVKKHAQNRQLIQAMEEWT